MAPPDPPVSACRIDLDRLAWTSPVPNMRAKAIEHGDARFRIVEFAAGFAEPEWCARAHRGLVLDGTLVVDFDGGSLEIEAGAALDIPAGEAHRHRARPAGALVRLFLVDPL